MRKIVILSIIAVFINGCSTLALRKDQHHKAPFAKRLKEGSYEIGVYRVNYPEKYEERILFLGDYDAFLKKEVIADKKIFLLYPRTLTRDIESIKKNMLLPEELIFTKPTSELTKDEKGEIDRKVKAKLSKEIGENQRYLRKQIIFLEKTWKLIEEAERAHLKDKGKDGFELLEEYIKSNEVEKSEEDKEEIILKIKKQRKEILDLIKNTKIVEIKTRETPYKVQGEKNWLSKDIKERESLEVVNEVTDELEPQYIKNLKEREVKRVEGREIVLKGKFNIIENNLYSGYTIENKKIIFYTGGSVEKEYYDNYKVDVVIKDMGLLEILKDERNSDEGEILKELGL